LGVEGMPPETPLNSAERLVQKFSLGAEGRVVSAKTSVMTKSSSGGTKGEVLKGPDKVEM